mmetsp:Transcript_46208/g.119077  ORF Transcript_46208/g.119077 Transcript_46208/m.119077 type:complete len:101 (-) Transcript_46208:486-788(-)
MNWNSGFRFHIELFFGCTQRDRRRRMRARKRRRRRGKARGAKRWGLLLVSIIIANINIERKDKSTLHNSMPTCQHMTLALYITFKSSTASFTNFSTLAMA